MSICVYTVFLETEGDVGHRDAIENYVAAETGVDPADPVRRMESGQQKKLARAGKTAAGSPCVDKTQSLGQQSWASAKINGGEMKSGSRTRR
jgi:hypothetical protein